MVLWVWIHFSCCDPSKDGNTYQPVHIQISYQIKTTNKLHHVYVSKFGNGKLATIIWSFCRSNYRTPVKGLYMCGSGSHPGGGVMGAPGRNAAFVVLQDLNSPWP